MVRKLRQNRLQKEFSYKIISVWWSDESSRMVLTSEAKADAVIKRYGSYVEPFYLAQEIKQTLY